MKITLRFVRETDKARLYCRLPESRHPGEPTAENSNYLWIPRSLCEHTSKGPIEPGLRQQHVVDVADWFAEKNDL